MSNTITIRLPEDLRKWLEETSRSTGIPIGRLVRNELERAKENQEERPYMKLAGCIKGPRDLSMRKGYSRG